MRLSVLHFLWITLLFLSFTVGCVPAVTPPAATPAPHLYTASDAVILNPERGFFAPYTLPGSAGFSAVRLIGKTLVHLNIRLDKWRETDIPQKVLDGLQTNFDDIRAGGVKAILRVAYNNGPYPDSEPDASKAQILRHITQLTPLLQNNADVIAWVEAGFIGAWGEWHTSTHGLDNLPDKQEILFALLKALPETRAVQVRYPANILEMFPAALTEKQAFDGSNQARVAHHNDCFLSSNTDVGTYERDGSNTMARDQAYLTELTRFTPMSGESCAPNPPRSECTIALQEMALLHFSSINEAFHEGILRSWKDGGCMEEISNRMGYRLTLLNADFNEQISPGGTLDLTVHLSNTGFASMINERHLYVVLLAQDGSLRHQAKVEIDPRRWEPGKTQFNVKVHIPTNAKAGEYKLALWLPDGYESLRDNPLYAIQFANTDLWDEATGLNLLGNVSITEGGGGAAGDADTFRVLSAESHTTRDSIPPVSNPTSVPTEPAASQISLISNVEILNKASTLTIKFAYAGNTEDYNAFQVFLDTDQNPSTGYAVSGTGADYLLENGALSHYTGKGSDWTWAATDGEILFDTSNHTVQWLFDSAMLGKPVELDVVCRLMDKNWNAVFTTSKQGYTLK